MLDETYLVKGLTSIGRCKENTGDIWQAHFGSAVIAAYFFSLENRVPDKVELRIASQVDSMISRHQEAFQPVYPRGKSGASDRRIAEALEGTVDRLCWVGHNVIYTSLTLKALRQVPTAATPELIEGVATLIRSFEKSIPGRRCENSRLPRRIYSQP